MAALWSAAELSAWELEDAAQAGVFYTASGAAGLSSTLSWGTDKAAATPWSPKECALVADFQAAMARKRLDAIPEAGEELSVEPAKPDFAFAPDDDSFGKLLLPFTLAPKIDLAGVCQTDSEGEESDGGEDVFTAGPGLLPCVSDGELEPEGRTPGFYASFLEESAALGTPFGGSEALWTPEAPATVEQAPPPTRKRSRAQDAPLALPAPADEAEAPVVAPRNRSGRRSAGAGGNGGKRWSPEEDAVLRVAVAENRGAPNKRSQNGIWWMDIQKRATLEYPALLRHLPADIAKTGSRTLSKRWCQYLCPDDQVNKERVWR